MKKIKQIYDLLQNLPEKDIPIAVKLLDKRDFIGLKELVDSDVYIVNNAKFKQKVVPGDRLDLECEIIKQKGPLGVAAVKATVNGKVACKGEISFMIR